MPRSPESGTSSSPRTMRTVLRTFDCCCRADRPNRQFATHEPTKFAVTYHVAELAAIDCARKAAPSLYPTPNTSKTLRSPRRHEEGGMDCKLALSGVVRLELRYAP